MRLTPVWKIDDWEQAEGEHRSSFVKQDTNGWAHLFIVGRMKQVLIVRQ